MKHIYLEINIKKQKQMWYKEDEFIVRIGGNTYENCPNLIEYKGENIFTIKRAESTDLLGIDFDIYDEFSNKVATIKQGRIYTGDKENYETIISQDRFLLKEKKTERVICDIKKRTLADKVELDVNVSLFTKDGFLINASPEKTNLGGMQMVGCHFSGCKTAISI